MAEEVQERLARIEDRLDLLETLLTSSLTNQRKPAGQLSVPVSDLLSLPDSLRRTLLALQNLSETTSTDVAAKTGRTRSMETVYLNPLYGIEYVTRRRRGRRVYFRVARYY